MSDIFREVDEDIRQEKYRRLWDRFGPWLIGVAVLIVVGTGGYRGWLYWQDQQSQAAGDTFFEAVQLSEQNKFEDAAVLYGELEGAIGGYPEMARFRRATDLANAGETEDALAEFDALSRDSSLMSALRDLAALRAAYLAVDSEDYSAIADRVEKLTADDGPFRSAAREVLALSAWKDGNTDVAREWLAALESDPATPAEVNRRAGVLRDLIKAATGDAASTSEGNDQ